MSANSALAEAVAAAEAFSGEVRRLAAEIRASEDPEVAWARERARLAPAVERLGATLAEALRS